MVLGLLVRCLFMWVHGGREVCVACVVCPLMALVCCTERALCICIWSLECSSLFSGREYE
jgi:hypothetical protein